MKIPSAHSASHRAMLLPIAVFPRHGSSSPTTPQPLGMCTERLRTDPHHNTIILEQCLMEQLPLFIGICLRCSQKLVRIDRPPLQTVPPRNVLPHH